MDSGHSCQVSQHQLHGSVKSQQLEHDPHYKTTEGIEQQLDDGQNIAENLPSTNDLSLKHGQLKLNVAVYDLSVLILILHQQHRITYLFTSVHTSGVFAHVVSLILAHH